eukprot:scaffold40800_cov69-Phaeocystis_antarctica.AAC.3
MPAAVRCLAVPKLVARLVGRLAGVHERPHCAQEDAAVLLAVARREQLNLHIRLEGALPLAPAAQPHRRLVVRRAALLRLRSVVQRVHGLSHVVPNREDRAVHQRELHQVRAVLERLRDLLLPAALRPRHTRRTTKFLQQAVLHQLHQLRHMHLGCVRSARVADANASRTAGGVVDGDDGEELRRAEEAGPGLRHRLEALGGADELQRLLPAAKVVDLDLLHAHVLRRVPRVAEDDLLLGDLDGGRGQLRGARVVVALHLGQEGLEQLLLSPERHQLQPRQELLDGPAFLEHLERRMRVGVGPARRHEGAAQEGAVMLRHLPQRILSGLALQVSADAARLALPRRAVALGERAKALELARHGRARELLARAVAREQHVLGRHELVGPPAALVVLVLVGVQRDAGRARVGEDRDQLLAALEARALREVEVGERHALLGTAHQPVAAVGAALQPVRPARHLGDVLRAEEVQQRVERGGRQRQVVQLPVDRLAEARPAADKDRVQALAAEPVEQPLHRLARCADQRLQCRVLASAGCSSGARALQANDDALAGAECAPRKLGDQRHLEGQDELLKVLCVGRSEDPLPACQPEGLQLVVDVEPELGRVVVHLGLLGGQLRRLHVKVYAAQPQVACEVRA